MTDRFDLESPAVHNFFVAAGDQLPSGDWWPTHGRPFQGLENEAFADIARQAIDDLRGPPGFV